MCDVEAFMGNQPSISYHIQNKSRSIFRNIFSGLRSDCHKKRITHHEKTECSNFWLECITNVSPGEHQEATASVGGAFGRLPEGGCLWEDGYMR